VKKMAAVLGLTVAASTGAALALGGSGAAGATSDVSASPGQLLINQRIAQAAVRRSNQALNLLYPIRTDVGRPPSQLGWTSSQLLNGSVTTQKLGPVVAGLLPVKAAVSATGQLAAPRGATAVAHTGTGSYTVTFGRDISACPPAATIAAISGGLPPAGMVRVGINPANKAQMLVATTDVTGKAADRPFTLVASC
jgi:hypothetical protein